jgi:hypothetical protein
MAQPDSSAAPIKQTTGVFSNQRAMVIFTFPARSALPRADGVLSSLQG